MIDQAMIVTAGSLLLAAALGLGLGRLYFMAVRRTAAMYGTVADWRMPAALTAGRMLAAALVFVGAAQFGAGPLLAAFIGFLVARRLALRGGREGMA